ncbi:hypothetical protein B0H14DRAFT_2191176, partial [Mycena olivaceomarginata]
QYLHLLFLHPNARKACDLGTHLWMQTRYAFIALYKQCLQRPHHQHNNNLNRRTGGNTQLLQRFRQFLADEERFW